jgi:hypothetical protein
MRASRGVVLASVLAAALLGGVGSAQAGEQAAGANAAAQSPQSICGSGYYVQRQHKLPGAIAYQLYNGSSNCAVTIKTASIGTPTRTTAGLQVQGASWSYDTGDYAYYAGPVRAKAAGKCVRYFGYHGGTSYTSPFGNCG